MPRVSTATHKRMMEALPALRTIHHKYAARVARQAAVVHMAAKRLVALQKAIEREAEAVAGQEYREWHDVGYDTYGSLKEHTDEGETQLGAGLADLVETAREIVRYAERVAAEREPPTLPSE